MQWRLSATHNKYLINDKKCLVFEGNTRAFFSQIDRAKIINENGDLDSFRCFSRVERYGNLTVTHHPFLDADSLLYTIDKLGADIVIYEEVSTPKEQVKELIKLNKELRKRNKTLIFVTHLKRKLLPFARSERHIPSASRYRRAIPYFDAVAIIYRNEYYDESKTVVEEIRVYERGKKKYRSIPVKFDFMHQKIMRK